MVENYSSLSNLGFHFDNKNKKENENAEEYENENEKKEKEKEKKLSDIYGDYFAIGTQQNSISAPVSVSTELSPSIRKSPLKEIIVKVESEKTNKVKPPSFLASVAASAQRVARKWSKTNSATTSTKESNIINRTDSCQSDSVETVFLTASKSDSESIFDTHIIENSLFNLDLNEKTNKTPKELEIEIVDKKMEIFKAMTIIGNHMTQCNIQLSDTNNRTILKDLKSPGDEIEVPTTDFLTFGEKVTNLMLKTRLLCDLLSYCDTNNININNDNNINTNIYEFDSILSCH